MKNTGKFLQANLYDKEEHNERFLFLFFHLEFTNLIEACKWLIEAGYAQYVHSFLSKILFYIICLYKFWGYLQTCKNKIIACQSRIAIRSSKVLI